MNITLQEYRELSDMVGGEQAPCYSCEMVPFCGKHGEVCLHWGVTSTRKDEHCKLGLYGNASKVEESKRSVRCLNCCAGRCKLFAKFAAGPGDYELGGVNE